ncbi:peptidyl-prolyl cis-trans isomerase CYP21-4-like isoform X1 [Aristolochia californica]|uniref:peptidyl-prolyl cis-trans isomerase CYP21-4-like isoform X1 n=1 Tax=Aristolochia californica TaxID=171875 RepID=UPI0035D5A6CA
MARIKPQALLIQSKKKKGPTRISISTIVTCNLIVVLIVLSLVATYRHWSLRSRTELEDGSQNIEDAEARELKFELPSYAVLNTSKGLITVELHKESSPEIVDRFLDLCNKGYFKGMLFHRVVKNFVIEGGEPQGVGTAEDWTSRGKTQSQLATSPKHEAFMLGTSKMKQDNSGFQLFVTTAPIPDLNDKLIVFGRVIKGEDIVQEIEEVDTDEHFRPKSPIGIINIILKREP